MFEARVDHQTDWCACHSPSPIGGRCWATNGRMFVLLRLYIIREWSVCSSSFVTTLFLNSCLYFNAGQVLAAYCLQSALTELNWMAVSQQGGWTHWFQDTLHNQLQ